MSSRTGSGRTGRRRTSSRVVVLSVLLAGLVTAGGQGTSSAADAPATRTGATASAASAAVVERRAYAAEVLRLLNAERRRVGLRPLVYDGCAATFANRQNAVIAGRARLSHQDLRPVLRHCRARGAGENVAYGSVTPGRIMQMWMASRGHRANILRASYTHVAISAVKDSRGRWYATQVFLTR